MTDIREKVARAIYEKAKNVSWDTILERNAPNVIIYREAADAALSACGHQDLVKALDGLLKVFVEDLAECGYDEDDIADHEQVKAARAALEKAGKP